MKEIVKIAENVYEISAQKKIIRVRDQIKTFNMQVPVRVYANNNLIEKIKKDRTLDQLTNVACLPGIQKFAIGLSDSHQGYGFNIGGVAAKARIGMNHRVRVTANARHDLFTQACQGYSAVARQDVHSRRHDTQLCSGTPRLGRARRGHHEHTAS